MDASTEEFARERPEAKDPELYRSRLEAMLTFA